MTNRENDFVFDKEAYRSANDKLTLSADKKNSIIREMRGAADSSYKQRSRVRGGIWKGAVAAALVAAVLFGGIASNTNGGTAQENSFVISVYAEEACSQSGLTELSFSEAGISGGWTAGLNEYMNEDGKYDSFFSFSIEGFVFSGSNIENVSVHSNSDYIYFALDEDMSYTAIEPLTHSQYTQKELTTYCGLYGEIGDGYTTEEFYDDSYTKGFQGTNFSLRLVAETNRHNATIDELAQEYYDAAEAVLGSESGMTATEEDNERYNKAMYCLLTEMLKGATLDVTASFTDGTSQTFTLQLSFTPIMIDDRTSYSLTAKIIDE